MVNNRLNRNGSDNSNKKTKDDLKLFAVMGVIILIIIGGYVYYNNGSQDNGSDKMENDHNDDQIQAKEIRITASQWDFTPSTININKGDRVKLILTSNDVAHGLSLQEFDVDMYISETGETSAEFTADRSGTFTFYCSVYCGDGHGDMKGTLIVT